MFQLAAVAVATLAIASISGSSSASRSPSPSPPPSPQPGIGSPPFGTAWVRSDASEVELAVVKDDKYGQALRWTKPKKPTVLMTYLKEPLTLAKAGDVAAVKFMWRSDGVNKCDPFDWADGKSCACKQAIKEQCEPGKGTPHCARTSVNCLEGTGDFRLALMEPDASPEPTDNFCPTDSGDGLHACIDKIGAGYHAYQFRFMPHVGTTYVHPSASEAGGFFCKQNSTDPFDDHRLQGHWTSAHAAANASGVFPGFGVPNSEWVEAAFTVQRQNMTTYAISARLGAVQYNYTHTWNQTYANDMPQSIGAVGIWFPNSREYTFVELAASA